MTLPLAIHPSPFAVLNDVGVDSQLIRPFLDSLASKFDDGYQKIVDQFAQSHSRAVGSGAPQILPRILEIIDRNSVVFRPSGIARAIKSNINNTEGAPGLLHELEVFHVVESSKHRTAPTLLRSEIGEQEIDVRTRFFEGLEVLFEAKLRGTRSNQSQFHRLVHAAMHVGAKLVYVSASDSVHDAGLVSLSDLRRMLDRASPDEITERLNLAHETNLLEFKRDNLERLPKSEMKARIRTRIESTRRARSILTIRENRDNVALLDHQLTTLSVSDAISLWNWIGAKPELADIRFQLLYEQGLAESIVQDSSGELLKEILNS